MNEPKLRFKADSETPFPDWEEKKIGELGTFTKGAPLSKADKKYYSHVGDVVIPTSGETAEEISTATCVMAQNVILAGDLNIYRSDIVDGRIMSYILNHQAKWKIATLAQGKSVVHIQAAQLSGVAVKYPPSTVEQQKIASLFTELDTLIQSAEKELEGYRELKRGMLQKMFPKKGELVPEIRFPEFEGDWEQRKLGDVTEVITKGTTPHDKSWVGPVNYIRTESIDKETGLLSQTCATSIEEHEGYLKRSQLKENDVLFSIVGTMGRVGLVKSKDLPANTNQQIAIIRLKEMYPEFVLNALKTPSIDSYVGIETTIGAQPSLSLWQIEKMEIPVPSYREQEKIGVYFNNLDNLITLQQRELDGYKELKKGLLQQMFC